MLLPGPLNLLENKYVTMAATVADTANWVIIGSNLGGGGDGGLLLLELDPFFEDISI